MILTKEKRDALLQKYLPPLNDKSRESANNILLDRGLSVHSYRDIPIEDDFWNSGPQDNRTWRFSLHSFAALDALMTKSAWGMVEFLVREWIEQFGEIDPERIGRFPWHDHATALRLDRLSMMALAEDGPDFPKLAEQHASLLLRDDFYSKHTNHGYDQALALLLASRVFGDACDTAEWERVAMERLIDELQFAFNEEGVHVENSPAYHVGMTANLVRARFVKNTLGIKSDFDFDDLLNKALLFTAWITGPDRKLALLGDSTERGGAPPAELDSLPNFQHAAYAASGGIDGSAVESKTAIFPHAGYAVYRSSWFPWGPHTHLVMKSGFLSRYHRQDDDLNILIQAYGEHWLIDSGLYNHNQSDPIRIYMRSALAHNVPFIRGSTPLRTLPTPEKAPTLEMDLSEGDAYEAVFRGTTQMYRNIRLTRTIMIENRDTFQVIDQISYQGAEPERFIQFHVPADKTVTTTAQTASIQGRSKRLSIRVASGDAGNCNVWSGMDGEFQSVYSANHNISVDSQVIVFGPIQGNRIRFRLEFLDIEMPTAAPDIANATPA